MKYDSNYYYFDQSTMSSLINKYKDIPDSEDFIKAVDECFSFKYTGAKASLLENVFNHPAFTECDLYGLRELAVHLTGLANGQLEKGNYSNYTYTLSLLGKIKVLVHHFQNKRR